MQTTKTAKKSPAINVTKGEDTVERARLSFLTNIDGKSTIANALTKLKSLGWMTVSGKEVTITKLGMENADQDALAAAAAAIPKTNADHWEKVKEKNKLNPKQTELVELLQDGKTHDKKQVIMEVYEKSNSTSANALTFLKKLKIIEVAKGKIRLHDEMFPVEPRPED
ncbi:expressed unknown protein [Seminavis robusta]|uniref:Uncharacterized protein n=1 Tax=Seminavis robusta TaxID=568900 RepID=A0A9N8H7B5_9STRA|nr:expressed unknown protein [Seminavis robusta]|eukprot:Sro198_g084240.1 n/a (168) ;mRNA; f:91082-91673